MSNISDEDGEDGENSYEAASKKKVLERKNAQHLEIKQQRYAVIGAATPGIYAIV